MVNLLISNLYSDTDAIISLHGSSFLCAKTPAERQVSLLGELPY
jgi:hypothetical protein